LPICVPSFSFQLLLKMMSYTTTESTSRPTAPRKSRSIMRDENQLSKSLGDAPLIGQLCRVSSEISSINHSGYLLKRSNNPFDSVSRFANTGFNDDGSENDSPPPVEKRIPQHLESISLTIPLMNVVDERISDGREHIAPQEEKTTQGAVDRSSDILASFFGLGDDASTVNSDGDFAHDNFEDDTGPVANLYHIKPASISPPAPPRNSIKKSSPIRFGRSNCSNEKKLPKNLRRCDSTPCVRGSSPAADVIDPKDGHIWRANYCVLEDGILYFYRNEIDGETIEAQLERVNKTSIHMEDNDQPTFDNLSKSPMVSRRVLSGMGSCNKNPVVWEKRVALDCVGAVRSTELEYGPFSFELVASGSDKDRLVLRAQNAEELNEWLFKFHCSLASFMKNMVNAMDGKFSRTNALDLHSLTPPIAFSPSMDGSSPGPHISSFVESSSLSHGHGRSGLFRRQATERDREANPSDDTSQMILFPLDQPLKLPKLPCQSKGTSLKQLAPKIEMKNSEQDKGKLSSKPRMYVPPHLRNKDSAQVTKGKPFVPPCTRSPQDETKTGNMPLSRSPPSDSLSLPSTKSGFVTPEQNDVKNQTLDQKLGGCADPRLITGSIMDEQYKKRMSSKVGKAPAEAYGCYGGGSKDSSEPSLRWEVGAISECGVRNSNEDSFLICTSAFHAFSSLPHYEDKPTDKHEGTHDPGFFAIFDGHCGNEAARFSAERLHEYLYDEWKTSDMDPGEIKNSLQKALKKLDYDFCRICMEDGRNWESGSTAIVAAVVDEELIVSSLGDCRAVACRSTHPHDGMASKVALQQDGWDHVEVVEDLNIQWEKALSESDIDDKRYREWYWKEVADVHDPSRADEKKRIEEANGWITSEKEIPIGQLQRMDFCDGDVVEILKRCFSDRYNQSERAQTLKRCNSAPQRIIQIFRICGELAVSRAIGDRDFKADFNRPKNGNSVSIDDSFHNSFWWNCPLPLPYPDDHSKQFKEDLVTSEAESRNVKLSSVGAIDEFLVLGCDGLWDVMDPDDVVRVTFGLLFEKKWPARKAAARLAELAIHLGSSDNITVIVIRFFRASKF